MPSKPETGNFDIKLFPPGGETDGAIFVSHPLGGTQVYGPDDPDDFWAKDVEDKIETAVGVYVRSIDLMESDVGAVQKIDSDAYDIGVEVWSDGGDDG